MKITETEFRRELAKMVESPAWPEIVGWWTEQLVRRAVMSPDTAKAIEQAGPERAGAVALLLSIENEVTRSLQEAIHDSRSRVSRAASAAADQRQGGGAGRAKRSGGTGKQAAAKKAGK
jgi:hypothetical protein